MRNKQTGFTLIELIAGIVVIAIVTLVVTTGLGQLFRQSVDPWQQIRATEVGQSLMKILISVISMNAALKVRGAAQHRLRVLVTVAPQMPKKLSENSLMMWTTITA